MSRTDCPNIETNEARCTCTSQDCERHGLCCQCLAAHMEANSLTHCLRDRIQQNEDFRENVAGLIQEA